MDYVKIAQTTDFIMDHKKKVSYEGKEILLMKLEDGYYAIDNKCTHMGGSLYDGNLEGNTIVCPRHGSAFDVRTGKVVKQGKILFIKVTVPDTRSYLVKVEGTDILISPSSE